MRRIGGLWGGGCELTVVLTYGICSVYAKRWREGDVVRRVQPGEGVLRAKFEKDSVVKTSLLLCA